jgi:hypothetical protein
VERKDNEHALKCGTCARRRRQNTLSYLRSCGVYGPDGVTRMRMRDLTRLENVEKPNRVHNMAKTATNRLQFEHLLYLSSEKMARTSGKSATEW